MLRVGVAVRAAQNGNSGDRRAGATGWRSDRAEVSKLVQGEDRTRPAVATLISPSYPERAAARAARCADARQQMRQQQVSGAGLGGLLTRRTR